MKAAHWLCGVLWLTLLGTAAWAQPDALPSEPMLRINASSHTAALRSIATDAMERFAATASDDKTVRVWSLPNGTLQRVIRLPSGDGAFGKANAVAMSPDGSTIAVGGWTGKIGAFNIYLFERTSGELVKRLPSGHDFVVINPVEELHQVYIDDLPDVVTDLKFSPDGRRLAAAVATAGIRVFDVGNDYHPLPSDRKYSGMTRSISFDQANRLVSASLDGFVRLYSSDRYDRPTVETKVLGMGRLHSAAFSSDGRHIAIGDYDSAKVAVLRDRDLKVETFPVTTGLNCTQVVVAWSQNGQQLFAGGYQDTTPDRLRLRRWDEAGAGSPIDIPGTRNTVFQFVPLPDQRMLFLDGSGFGFINSAGKVERIQARDTINFMDIPDVGSRLAISADARTVQVRDFTSGHALRFMLTRRAITVDPEKDEAMISAITGSDHINVTDWEDTFNPKVNGERLILEHDEMSRSIALVPGSNQIVLGTERSLRKFSDDGNEVWHTRHATPGAAWGVNVSADGKLIVAAYGDGTIRWHRVSDGTELLALFMHPDGKRWVAWTPQGYYDASASADDLIGWQVNRGYDRAPDFFPASQFQQRFNRRDVIARVLDTLDVDKAVEEANKAANQPSAQAAPLSASTFTPVVSIKDPATISEQTNRDFSLTYAARMTSPDPILRVEARVDGVEVPAKDMLVLDTADTRVGTLHLTLPLRDAKISVIAYNANGASAPASIEVHWKGPGREDKVTLYVLAIGVTHYNAKDLPEVHFPAKDARDFITLAKQQQGSALYGRVVTWPAHESLEDEQATRDNILDGLDWIRHAVQTPNDVAMIFLSGHGVNDTHQHYRFLPYDYDPNRLERTTIADIEFQQYISDIQGKTLFFFDTCFSGNVLGGKAAGMTPDVDRFANELRSAQSGVVVFASSTGNELSWEPPKTKDPTLSNGAFAWAVLEGLRGKAARQGIDVISLTDLYSYLSHTVPEETFGNQHPTFAMPKTVQDYPIIAVAR